MEKSGPYLAKEVVSIVEQMLLEIRNDSQEQALEKIHFVGNFLEKINKKMSVEELRLAAMAAASITSQRYNRKEYEKIIRDAEKTRS